MEANIYRTHITEYMDSWNSPIYSILTISFSFLLPSTLWGHKGKRHIREWVLSRHSTIGNLDFELLNLCSWTVLPFPVHGAEFQQLQRLRQLCSLFLYFGLTLRGFWVSHLILLCLPSSTCRSPFHQHNPRQDQPVCATGKGLDVKNAFSSFNSL